MLKSVFRRSRQWADLIKIWINVYIFHHLNQLSAPLFLRGGKTLPFSHRGGGLLRFKHECPCHILHKLLYSRSNPSLSSPPLPMCVVGSWRLGKKVKWEHFNKNFFFFFGAFGMCRLLLSASACPGTFSSLSLLHVSVCICTRDMILVIVLFILPLVLRGSWITKIFNSENWQIHLANKKHLCRS